MKIIIGGIAVVFVCVSCTTLAPPPQIEQSLYQGNFSTAAALLNQHRQSLYRAEDLILYYLDRGMLEHYAGKYRESSDMLERAAQAIDDAFTKSIRTELASYIINDTVRNYDGEDYENIYSSAFNALNYYHRNDVESALIDVRRMNYVLEHLSEQYEQLTGRLEQTVRDNGAEIPRFTQGTNTFHNSAFARYLGMLLYRSNGKYDDARIDSALLSAAFNQSPHIYPFPIPSSIADELTVPSGMARLNIIAFTGLSPIKREDTIRIALADNREQYIKIVLPTLQNRPSALRSLSAVFDNGYTVDMELLEDIQAVAHETFKEKAYLLYAKSVARSVLKGAGTKALQEIIGQNNVLSSGLQLFNELSERADTRIARYFPAKVYVGAVNLAPGTYSFTINYYGERGQLISAEQKTVTLHAQKLNLVEVLCLN
ncbi:MAG: hypothetical protein LBQ77_04510 [Treponema sp.]|jgi:hypothetical protein|nr:hypothetical protein [Treponema sp.]